MSIPALLNVNQLAARKGAHELEFAVKKVHSLDASKGGPEGYLEAIIRRVEDIVIEEIRRFENIRTMLKVLFAPCNPTSVFEVIL